MKTGKREQSAHETSSNDSLAMYRVGQKTAPLTSLGQISAKRWQIGK